MTKLDIRPGDTVRAFDPRTVGVVKHGKVLSVGPRRVRIDFGVTRVTYVRRHDVLEVTDR